MYGLLDSALFQICVFIDIVGFQQEVRAELSLLHELLRDPRSHVLLVVIDRLVQVASQGFREG